MASSEEQQPPPPPPPQPPPSTSIVDNKDFRQALTCPVCLDFYKRPCHLSSCPHSLCGECIANLFETPSNNGEDPESLTCPVCRQESWIQEDKGLNGFQVNIELKRLVELFIEHDDQIGEEAKRQKLNEIAYNNRDPQRQAEFFEACMTGNLEKVRQMLEQPRSDLLIETRYHRPKHGCIRENTWYSNNTCLHIASWEGHDEVVALILKTYLEQKKDCTDRSAVLARFINEQGLSSGWTALHCAAFKGQTKCIQQLCGDEALKGIVDLEIRTLDGFNHPGFTALMLAAYCGHSEAVQELVKNGAQINARHVKSGRTALGWAKEQGFNEVVEILAKAGSME